MRFTKTTYIISFFIICCTLLFSEENSDNKKLVKIGYMPNYGVLNDPYIRGSEGYGYDYFEEISRYTNHTYEFISLSWIDGFTKLQNGEIDLFGPVSKTPIKEEQYSFTKNALGYNEALILASKTSTFSYGDVANFNGRTLRLINDSVFIEELNNYCHKNNISFNLDYIEDSIDFYPMYKELDVLYLANALNIGEDAKIVDKIGQAPFYFIAKKGNEELLAEIDGAIDSILKQDRLFADKLYLQYYSEYELARPIISKEELALIQQKNVYTVGFNAKHEPLTYIDSNNKPKGIAIDVMNEIAKRAGITIEYVPIDHRNNTETHTDFNLCVIGGHWNGERISEPYLKAPMIAINKTSVNHTKPSVISVIDYNTINLQQHTLPYLDAEIVKTLSMEESFLSFENDKTDRIFLSIYGAEVLYSIFGKKDLEIVPLDLQLPLCISVSEDLSIEIYDIINKFIKMLEPDLMQTLIIKNMSKFTSKKNLSELFFEHRILIFSILAAVLLILLFVTIFLTAKKKQELSTAKNIDSLTGLFTRHKFFIEVENILSEAKSEEYTIYSIDIDNFKNINTTHTYIVGDQVLNSLAEKIQSYFKKGSIIARQSSDTFIILEKNIKIGGFYAPQIHADFESLSEGYINEIGSEFNLSLSCGIYIVDTPNEDLSYMLDCAHSARLKGKRIYGFTSFEFTEEMLKKQLNKNTIESMMVSALENEEFKMFIQPKYNLNTGLIDGGEALVRWAPRVGPTIFPDEFISIFENNGFIVNLDLYMFEKLCDLIKHTPFELPLISVNMSGITAMLTNSAELYNRIISKYKVSPSAIEFEITESAFIDNTEQIFENINEFKRLGFSVSVDDFGTGVSSLSRLKDMNVDTLKLDKTFIDSNLLSEKGFFILKNVISLSKDLRLTVVGEGIETAEQMNVLRRLGCDLGQGYYFAKPLEIDSFLNLVEKKNIKENINSLSFGKTGKLLSYMEEFEKIHSGVMILKNDTYFTLMKANDAAYNTIGFTRQELFAEHKNKFTNIMIGDVSGICHKTRKMISSNVHKITLEYGIKNHEGKIVWIKDTIEFDIENDVFYDALLELDHMPKEIENLGDTFEYCSLTGLLTHYGLECAYNTIQEKNGKDALIIIRVDFFSSVNEIFGFEEGDNALIILSDILKRTIADSDLVGRFGEDGFLIYIKNILTLVELQKICEELKIKLSYSYKGVVLTPYIGAVWNKNGTLGFDKFLTLCNNCLHKAIKNKVSSYEILTD